jgi:hypothetical protein
MNVLNKIKILFTLIFESKSSINKYINKYSGKRVLILGDGISAAYATPIFQKYDYIIACNNSINHKNLDNCNILFHVIMEPDLLIPGKHDVVRELWKGVHKLFPTTKLVMNPFGRFFNFKAQYKNVIYLSPYHKLKISDKIIYKNFSAAFQAALGLALLCGFDKIDIVGFDAWLLSPKNNLRWYSNSNEPTKFDYFEKCNPEDFILLASKISKLSVYTYSHYNSIYSFIDQIKLESNLTKYQPSTDRYLLMRNDFKNKIKEIEYRYYPNGYIVNKN